MHREAFGYRADLDGLRAVAVVLVMLRHTAQIFNAPFSIGGFLGVDVFFVLSGFLITSLLLDEHRQRQRIALPAFYARRALRLLPALFLTLALVGVAAVLLDHGPNAMPFWRSTLAVLAYVGNWFPNLGPLTHTWSLAIEEQYYLLWPPILVLCLRHHVRVERLALVIALLFVGLCVAKIVFLWDGGHVRGLTSYTRVDGLLIGNALALWPSDFSWARARGVGLAALAGSMAIIIFLPERSFIYWRGAFSAFVFCVAVLIAHLTAHPSGSLASALSRSPLPAVGRISYGLYLFHFPVFLFVRQKLGVTPSAAVTAWVLSFICGASGSCVGS